LLKPGFYAEAQRTQRKEEKSVRRENRRTNKKKNNKNVSRFSRKHEGQMHAGEPEE
jgi:hypothetical protein